MDTSSSSSFEEFCGSEFWNATAFEQEAPQFTTCFLSIVPYWVPCGYLWLLFPSFMSTMRNHQQSMNNPWDAYVKADDQTKLMGAPSTFVRYTWVCNLKMCFNGFQIVLACVRWLGLLGGNGSTADVVSGPILIATYGLAVFELWYERRKGLMPMSFSFFFFLLNVVLGLLPLYDWILNEKYKADLSQFTVLVLISTFNLSCLALEFVPDFPYDKKAVKYDDPEKRVCPEVTATRPSQLYYFWMNKLMRTGFKRPLVADDMWDLPPRDQGKRLNPIFDRLWGKEVAKANAQNKRLQFGNCIQNGTAFEEETTFYKKEAETTPLLRDTEKSTFNEDGKKKKKKARPNMYKVLGLMLWKSIVISLIQKSIGDTMVFTTPLVLGALIDRLQSPSSNPAWQGYGLSFALMFILLVRSLLFAQSLFRSAMVGLHLKTVLMAAIFKKSLSLAPSAKKNTTVGEIVNLMSVDCQRLEEMCITIAFAWSTPYQIVLAVVLLYYVLGPSVLAGFGVMILLVPFTSLIGHKQKQEQHEVMRLKDCRIKLVNEILNGIKVLKLYAWEDEFKKKVTSIRDMEIKGLLRVAVLYIISGLKLGLAPFLVALCSFATYLLSDRENVLDAKKAFMSLALFNLLNMPINYVTTAIVFIVQRVNKFLNSDDLDLSNVTHDPAAENAVEISSGTFSWDQTSPPVLEGVNLKVPEGQLLAVVGIVGSGKSSLVSAILGEMEKLQGHVKVKDRIAYVSQQAWIQNASVRDNILFGSPYSRRRYQSCIQACQLERDLEILPAGDQTEIGEKGINLSGGQKQRVNLARSAYSNASIFLFDDPLSAVDAHVGKAIFDELIGPDGLLAKKTRILVTHGVQWLPFVDDIVVIADGRISEQGSYQALLEMDGAFAQFLKTYLAENLGQDTEDENLFAEIPFEMRHDTLVSSSIATADVDPPRKFLRTRTQSKESDVSHRSKNLSQPLKMQDTLEYSMDVTLNLRSIHPEKGQLTLIEKVETKKVDRQVFLAYWRAAGMWGLLAALASFLVFQALTLSANFWITKWTEDPLLLNESTRTTPDAIARSDYNITIFGLFGVGQLIAYLIYLGLFWFRMVRAGQRLHAVLLKRIFNAPMAFFDQTPIGRILNRFSRDVDVVDNMMPVIIRDFLNMACVLVSTLIVITILAPVFLVVLLPILVLFWGLQNVYVRTSRQLKRIESVSRSPIYSHFSEAITGAAVIRAYGAKERFILESEEKVDVNQGYFFATWGAIRWLQVNMDIIVGFIIFFSAFLQVISGASGSDAGLSVSYALQISTGITYLIRQVSDLETNIVSIERLKEYSTLEQEADSIIPHNRPEKEWPHKGDVTFANYQTRYREGLDLVLKGVNCHIQSGEKMGIVGRTGAGKSSLTLSLFRILEATGGEISIDGINIADIGLYDLRSKLTILPQDPVLFSGSLRMNLDPFDEYDDQQLWKALEQAHLKDFIDSQPEGLSYECGEEGSNLSIGQRQLVCLARALLRNTKVLILDEATAATDFETDSLIQKTIRDAFEHCTIITIAHRINTIMDYDRVMVMDAGVIKEMASPEELIQQQGIFYSMCHDAGLV